MNGSMVACARRGQKPISIGNLRKSTDNDFSSLGQSKGIVTLADKRLSFIDKTPWNHL